MKIWISDTKSATHRIVKINCEDHSGYEYFGDLNDDELNDYFVDLKKDIDVSKNMKLLKYYGYLHLLIINK